MFRQILKPILLSLATPSPPPLSSDNAITLLGRWRASRWLIDRIATALRLIGAIGLLQLYAILLASKVTLVFTIALILNIVTLVRRRGVCRRCGIAVGILVAGIVWLGCGRTGVLSRSVSCRGSASCPPCTAIRVHALTATSTSRNASEIVSALYLKLLEQAFVDIREHQEDEEGSNDNRAKYDPSSI